MPTELSGAKQVYLVHQRAELLARLVLTRKRGVSVHELTDGPDIGVDLFVRGGNPVGDRKVVPSFGVELLGTVKPLPSDEDANALADRQYRAWATKGVFLWPVLLMAFSMEGDEGYCGWLIEPFFTKNNRPMLKHATRPDMRTITKKSMDGVFHIVQEWYEAMAQAVVEATE